MAKPTHWMGSTRGVASSPPESPLRPGVSQGLDTATPSVTCEGRSIPGFWDEDLGSTLVFDRRKLEEVRASNRFGDARVH